MARPVTLGMINVLLKSQPMEERRRTLLGLVDEAGRGGCQIVLLPEWSDHHVTPEAGAAGREGKAAYLRVAGLEVDSPWMREAAGLARKHRMVVIPNVLLLEGARAFNSAVVFGPDGAVLGQYRKTHLAPEEGSKVEPGDAVAPVRTPYGTLGLSICYDINFPELMRCQELLGADLLLWTTMRQVETEEGLYRAVLPARAIEHGLPLAVATYVTPRQVPLRRPMTSAIFNAFGQAVAGGLFTQGVLRATVDLDERPLIRRCWGKPEWVDHGRYLRSQRRPDLYGALTASLPAGREAEPAARMFPELVEPVL